MSTLITEDMEEPKANGVYIVTRDDGSQFLLERLPVEDYADPWAMSLNEDLFQWQEILAAYAPSGYSIESLADHDARIRREALTHLSMTDIDVAIRAYEKAKYTWDDNNMPLRMAFKAVADHRERVS